MSASPVPQRNGGVRGFRVTLLVAMMIIVSAMTALGLFLAGEGLRCASELAVRAGVADLVPA